MLISWGSVSGEQDDCQLWLRDPRNSTLPWRHTLGRGQVQHLLQGLIPGRNYSVSLSCVAGPYWSSTKPLAVPMGGYAAPWGWGECRLEGGEMPGWPQDWISPWVSTEAWEVFRVGDKESQQGDPLVAISSLS